MDIILFLEPLSAETTNLALLALLLYFFVYYLFLCSSAKFAFVGLIKEWQFFSISFHLGSFLFFSSVVCTRSIFYFCSSIIDSIFAVSITFALSWPLARRCYNSKTKSTSLLIQLQVYSFSIIRLNLGVQCGGHYPC
jgi:hypothetical protein